jgi:membrane-associated protease RseP (regulator of RpoE activity)
MNFITYDLVLLVIFIVSTSLFLYKRRENLKRDGLLLLYKTKIGVKIINFIGKKYKRTLNLLSYFSIGLGFLLMIASLYLIGKVAGAYIFQNAEMMSLTKIPPIMPLLPYLPQLFKMSYLPPFYFIYWIVILAIIAITHEFSHGIFAVNKKVKIKSTGFGFFPFFLPAFLAAFVELDEKKMEKKKVLPQMAILSAGTFANVLVAIISFLLMVLFFNLSFTPAGIVFDTYSYSLVGLSNITSVNGQLVNNMSYDKMSNLIVKGELNNISAQEINYVITSDFLEKQKANSEYIILYADAPAIRANLSNTILKLNEVNTNSREQLEIEFLKYSPEDKIKITTLVDNVPFEQEITLTKNPINKTQPYLGIGFYEKGNSNIIGKFMSLISSFKNPSIYYIPKFSAAEFIYSLLWWLVLIGFSVAVMNMLPVGIFDGGRFFYLIMFSITKSKKKAKLVFSIVTYAFLALLAIVMIFWGIGLFK